MVLIFFPPQNQNFVKTLNFHLCLSKYLVLQNQNLALKNQNLGFLKLISFDFHSILGFLSLLSNAATQGLSTLCFNSVWYGTGHFYPYVFVRSDFVSWFFFQKYPNSFKGENWDQLGYFDTLPSTLSLIKVAAWLL